MIDVIIDFEFTGLDNTFITDNEIIQMKAVNNNTGQYVLKNFATDKRSNAGAFLKHRINNESLSKKLNKELFEEALTEIGIKKEHIYDSKEVNYHGFSVSQDLLMLRKYNIDIDIIDIREKLQLSKFEERLAIEGSSLECAYYIVLNAIYDISHHGDLDELIMIQSLFNSLKNLDLNKLFTVMPHGHCAGMPIADYVFEYRRQADGYRFNNSDILADSLNYWIDNIEDDDYLRFDDDDDDN